MTDGRVIAKNPARTKSLAKAKEFSEILKFEYFEYFEIGIVNIYLDTFLPVQLLAEASSNRCSLY